MFDLYDRFREAFKNPLKRRRTAVAIIAVVVIILAAFAVQNGPGIVSALATKRSADYATNASLFLNCIADERVGAHRAQFGLLPARVFFLRHWGAVEVTVGAMPHYDNDLDIYEIHNTFKRCDLVNIGGVELHSIRLKFTAHGYGPYQNLISRYDFGVNIDHLAPNEQAEFAVTDASMEMFFAIPPTSAMGETPLDNTEKPVRFAEGDYTTRVMARDPLFPVQLRKTAWKRSPCQFAGTATLTFNASHTATATLHIPKSCAGAQWIQSPLNP